MSWEPSSLPLSATTTSPRDAERVSDACALRMQVAERLRLVEAGQDDAQLDRPLALVARHKRAGLQGGGHGEKA